MVNQGVSQDQSVKQYRVNCDHCQRVTIATRNLETHVATCTACSNTIDFVSSVRDCPHNPVHAWSERNECKKLAITDRKEKSKRVREVFPTDEIPHLWAHKVQWTARNPGGNLYFRDSTIYSYGSHFPIARHITRKNKNAILFTTGTYSVTTARHLSMVRQAIPSAVPVFTVPVIQDSWLNETDGRAIDHAKNLKSYIAEIDTSLLKSARARSSSQKEYSHESARKLHAEALAYAKVFQLPRPKLPAIPALDSEGMKQIKAREAKRQAEQAEQTKRERAARLAEQAERIERWRNGENVGGFAYDLPTMLRIEGNEVVTSRGARFPISHAKRGLALVRSVVTRGEEWQTNGHTCHLGHYRIDRIKADGTVTAGCHVVTFAEIERIAAQVESFVDSSEVAVDSAIEA